MLSGVQAAESFLSSATQGLRLWGYVPRRARLQSWMQSNGSLVNCLLALLATTAVTMFLALTFLEVRCGADAGWACAMVV